MFCFPYAGGASDVFRGWRRHFPAEVDICLVHLPGRGKRMGERPFTRLNVLVEEIADVICAESPDPYVLYGHSMGALISFELARELRRRHSIGPRQLFLSGGRAPMREVFVGGKPVITQGQHPLQEEVVRRFEAVQKRLWGSGQ